MNRIQNNQTPDQPWITRHIEQLEQAERYVRMAIRALQGIRDQHPPRQYEFVGDLDHWIHDLNEFLACGPDEDAGFSHAVRAIREKSA